VAMCCVVPGVVLLLLLLPQPARLGVVGTQL
jgi:hypothetical protein